GWSPMGQTSFTAAAERAARSAPYGVRKASDLDHTQGAHHEHSYSRSKPPEPFRRVESARDDDAHHRDTRGVARRAHRAAQGGEGAHAARRRTGAAAPGAAMGQDRQGVSL